MATSNSQRIGIWAIAVIMILGTLGSFFLIVVANQNDVNDQQSLNEMQQKYMKQVQEYQKKLTDQASELSKKYYKSFEKYEDQPEKFNADKVTKLTTVDLKKGDGAVVKEGTEWGAYYVGWLPTGQMFDSSFNGKELRPPITSDMGLIEGWTKGMQGMRIGGVRVITIPAELAYGETGSGKIEPNTPIKFVVMAIPKPQTIPQPDTPQQ